MLPKTKSLLKDLPFIIFAAVIARILKDILLSFFDLNWYLTRNEFDWIKLVINWGLLGFFFFGILYWRNQVWRRKKG